MYKEFKAFYYYHSGHKLTKCEKELISHNYTSIACPVEDHKFWIDEGLDVYANLIPRVVQGWELWQWNKYCVENSIDPESIYLRGKDGEKLSANDMTGNWYLTDGENPDYVSFLSRVFIPWMIRFGAKGLYVDQPFLWGDFVPNNALVTKNDYNYLWANLNAALQWMHNNTRTEVLKVMLNVTTSFWGKQSYAQKAKDQGCGFWMESGGIWTEKNFDDCDITLTGMTNRIMFGKHHGKK